MHMLHAGPLVFLSCALSLAMACWPGQIRICTEMLDTKVQRYTNQLNSSSCKNSTMWIVIVRSPKTGWSMLWCINSATHSLFSTSWKHLLQRKPSPMGWWMDGSSLQTSHGGPKFSMANSYLVLMFWEKVYTEVQRGYCHPSCLDFVSWSLCSRHYSVSVV